MIFSKIFHPPGVWQILLKSFPSMLPADPPRGELLTETEDGRRLWLCRQSPYNITWLPPPRHTHLHTCTHHFWNTLIPVKYFQFEPELRSCTGITSAAWRCCWVKQQNLTWSLGYKQIIAPGCVLLKHSTPLKYCFKY